MASDAIMKALEFNLKAAQFQQNMDYRLEWDRGLKGQEPSYKEEEQAEQAAATRPEIPSSVPTSTPGPAGIPRTRFDTGSPVPPMPAQAPQASRGAAALLPPRRLGMGMRGMGRFGFGR